MIDNNIIIKINLSDNFLEKLLKALSLEQQNPVGLPMGLLEALNAQPKPQDSAPKPKARVGFKIK